MSWQLFLLGGVGLLLLLFASGLPVFLGFLGLNLLGLFLLTGDFRGVSLVLNSMFTTGTSISLAAIPLFILLGELLFRSGSVAVLFNAVDALVGGFRARLFAVSVVLSTLFGALSGSAMAVAAMMGNSLLPEMRRRGYDRKLAIGSILAGASLAPIIPPSVMAIVLGMLAKISIAGLLVAGILPGLLLALLFFLYVTARTLLRPALAPLAEDAGRPWSERMLLVAKACPLLLIIVTILGLILGGVATPTEAAAMGVLAALVVTAAMRRLSRASLWDSLRSTTSISCMIMVIMVSSVSFSQVLNMSGATVELVRVVTELDLPIWLMFVLLQLLPFLLCMFIDQIALMILLVPLYVPILNALGFDPLWFWTIFLINMSVGGITPPFGYTLFALKGVAQDVPMQEVYRAILPFILIFALGVTLLAIFPQIVLWLPSLL